MATDDRVDFKTLAWEDLSPEPGTRSIMAATRACACSSSARASSNRTGVARVTPDTSSSVSSTSISTGASCTAPPALVGSGPSGGSLGDVAVKNTVVACRDWVAADTWTCRLFGVSPSQVPFIKAGAKMGLGTMNLSSVSIRNV